MFTHDSETERTVSTGKLLGLFLLLVVLCGVFFVLGYSFGRSTAAASLKPAPAPASAPAAKPTANSSDYPDRYGASASPNAAPTTPYITSTPPPGAIPAPQTEPDPAPAVEQPYIAPSRTNPSRASANPAYRPAPPAPVQRKPVVPETARTTAPLGSYLVQVAAVSKKQDAEALSAALRRKQYQVFINQTESNGLYRIQIGPFGDRKDAEVVRLLLVSDGYTPIIVK